MTQAELCDAFLRAERERWIEGIDDSKCGSGSSVDLAFAMMAVAFSRLNKKSQHDRRHDLSCSPLRHSPTLSCFIAAATQQRKEACMPYIKRPDYLPMDMPVL